MFAPCTRTQQVVAGRAAGARAARVVRLTACLAAAPPSASETKRRLGCCFCCGITMRPSACSSSSGTAVRIISCWPAGSGGFYMPSSAHHPDWRALCHQPVVHRRHHFTQAASCRHEVGNDARPPAAAGCTLAGTEREKARDHRRTMINDAVSTKDVRRASPNEQRTDSEERRPKMCWLSDAIRQKHSARQATPYRRRKRGTVHGTFSRRSGRAAVICLPFRTGEATLPRGKDLQPKGDVRQGDTGSNPSQR